MNTEDALKHYNSITSTIFSDKNKKLSGSNGTFKASTLKAEMRKIISESHPDYTGDELMLDNTSENETGKA